MKHDWIIVANTDELADGQMKRVAVDGLRLLLVNDKGSYYAIDEMCSHEDYSLYFGCVVNGRIKCSLHGSYFDLTSGQALDEPAQEPIRTYPVKVVDHAIRVKTAN